MKKHCMPIMNKHYRIRPIFSISLCAISKLNEVECKNVLKYLKCPESVCECKKKYSKNSFLTKNIPVFSVIIKLLQGIIMSLKGL